MATGSKTMQKALCRLLVTALDDSLGTTSVLLTQPQETSYEFDSLVESTRVMVTAKRTLAHCQAIKFLNAQIFVWRSSLFYMKTTLIFKIETIRYVFKKFLFLLLIAQSRQIMAHVCQVTNFSALLWWNQQEHTTTEAIHNNSCPSAKAAKACYTSKASPFSRAISSTKTTLFDQDTLRWKQESNIH